MRSTRIWVTANREDRFLKITATPSVPKEAPEKSIAYSVEVSEVINSE